MKESGSLNVYVEQSPMLTHLNALCPPAVWVPHSLVLMSQLPGVVVVLSQF